MDQIIDFNRAWKEEKDWKMMESFLRVWLIRETISGKIAKNEPWKYHRKKHMLSESDTRYFIIATSRCIEHIWQYNRPTERSPYGQAEEEEHKYELQLYPD